MMFDEVIDYFAVDKNDNHIKCPECSEISNS